MKNTAIFFFALLNFILVFSSCSKKDDTKNDISIDEKNLTACPPNTNCQYFFSENADFDIKVTQGPLKAGASRVFWSTWETSYMTTRVYIKAPMGGTSFSLGKEDILNGKVEYASACPACYSVALRNVDGYVKGVNLTPDKSADQAKWILEAKIIREEIPQPLVGETPGPLYRDTVFLKQYFFANFVYN